MISEKIESDTERSLDRRFFHIENTIEEPGIYTIGVRFPRGAECSIKIKVSGIDIQGNIIEAQEISEEIIEEDEITETLDNSTEDQEQTEDPIVETNIETTEEEEEEEEEEESPSNDESDNKEENN